MYVLCAYLYFMIILFDMPSGLTTHAQLDALLRLHCLTKRSEPPAKMTGCRPTIQVYRARTLQCCCAYTCTVKDEHMITIIRDCMFRYIIHTDKVYFQFIKFRKQTVYDQIIQTSNRQL